MLSEAWFRFGLPLGTAIVLVGVLDTAANLYSAWMDFGGVILYKINYNFEPDAVTVTWMVIICIWNISNLGLLWIGVIIKGNMYLLMAWMVTTAFCALIALFLEIYTFSLAWGLWLDFVSEVYAAIAYFAITGYMLSVALLCLKGLRANEPLEPIGKGVRHILKFYQEDPTLCAKFLLISELVIIGEYFFTRQVMELVFARGLSGHEGDTNAAIIAEEYVIRILRFAISVAGIFCVTRGQVRMLKYWGAVYLAAIIASSIILIYLFFEWRSEHALFTFGYYITFVISLGYRIGILYVCSQVVRPFRSSNTFTTLQET